MTKKYAVIMAEKTQRLGSNEAMKVRTMAERGTEDAMKGVSGW